MISHEANISVGVGWGADPGVIMLRLAEIKIQTLCSSHLRWQHSRQCVLPQEQIPYQRSASALHASSCPNDFMLGGSWAKDERRRRELQIHTTSHCLFIDLLDLQIVFIAVWTGAYRRIGLAHFNTLLEAGLRLAKWTRKRKRTWRPLTRRVFLDTFYIWIFFIYLFF